MNEFNDHFFLVKEMNRRTFSHFQNHSEAGEYGGCEYVLSNVKYIQRTSKITPKKIGQFVTLWKRGNDKLTAPFEAKDDFSFVVIICIKGKKIGRFLFPKDVLIEQKIIANSSKRQLGKRGFRVYPAWDKPTSKEAQKTQRWQLNYFSEGLNLKE